MKMSVRDARAQFADVLSAAERGERVTITKNGKPVAEIGPPAWMPPKRFSWERLDAWRKERGLDRIVLPNNWQEDFDDPASARALFGPEYFDDELANS